MTLRTKTLLLVLSAVAALVGGLNLATRASVLTEFEAAERAEMASKVEATRRIIAMLTEEFSRRGLDWADWNDMAQFLADGNPGFIRSNVTIEQMTATGWKIIMIITDEGVERVAAMTGETGLVPVPASFRIHLPRLTQTVADSAQPIFGIAMVDDEPYLVSSMEIRKSNRSPGPRAGRFITASSIDQAWLERLKRFTFLQITLTRASIPPRDAREQAARSALAHGQSVFVSARDDNHIEGSAWLRDIYGAPVLLLRVEHNRAMKAHGDAILKSSTVGVLVAGGLLLLLCMAAVRSAVLRPLARLLSGVRHLESGESVQVRVESRDELGELASAFNRLAATIVSREQAQREANERTRLVLEATGDALITCRLDGALDAEASNAALKWFGPPVGYVWDYLFPAPENEALRTGLHCDLEQLANDFLPFELLAQQMPTRFERGGRSFGIEYRSVRWSGAGTRLLLIVSDLSAQAAAERVAHETREMQAVIAQLMRDPREFDHFCREVAMLLDRLAQSTMLDERKRDLHTLKGSSGLFGFFAFAAACHALEDELIEEPARLTPERIARLRTIWDESLERIAPLVRPEREGQIVLSAKDHQRLVRLIETHADHAQLARCARALTYSATASLFARFGRQVHRFAARLGKEVRFDLQDNDLRVRSAPLSEFLGALSHVISNAIDHGIESPNARRAVGKPRAGMLSVSTTIDGATFTVTVSDDGAGVDWDKVARSAARFGLPNGSQAELLEALFHEGFSTRDQVTSTSGRGMGLAAVRKSCIKLGGTIELRSELGRGTEFKFRFPLAAAENALGVMAFNPSCDAVGEPYAEHVTSEPSPETLGAAHS